MTTGLLDLAATAAVEQAWNERALAARPAADFAVWHWPEPAIVLGRSQQPRTLLVQAAAREALGEGRSLEVRSRGSGGGAVFCGPWLLGASVVLPTGHPLLGGSLVGAYRWLGEAYMEVLQPLGQATLHFVPPKHEEPWPVVPWACFGRLSPWEIVDGQGRKLTGLAQQRRRDATLLVSAMQLTMPPWETLAHVMGEPAADAQGLQRRTVGLDALTPPGADFPDTVAPKLALALQAAIGRRLTESAAGR